MSSCSSSPSPSQQCYYHTSIEFAGHNFWSGIVGTATAGPQKLSVLHEVAEAKVSNLDSVLRVQEKVLWLQVSVGHLVTGRGGGDKSEGDFV